MRLSFGQNLQQVQKQILSPRMIQSMEILQLPVMALQERIEQEMEENPILEMQEATPDVSLDESPQEERLPPDAPTEEERPLEIDEAKDNADDFERFENMIEQFPDYSEEQSRPSRAQTEQAGERKLDAMANMAARPESLHDYLHHQLGWFDLAPKLRAMADRVIYNLDTNGYLQGRIEDVLPPSAPADEIVVAEEALALVQKLDPPGVGARDLRECLLLQLTPGMPYYEQLQTLISSYLEYIEKNRLQVIAEKTGYSLDLIQNTLAELRKLNPKPGAEFNETLVPPVTPDVLVERTEDGRWEIRLEDDRVPSLFISPHYRKLIQSGKATQKEKEYIKKKIDSAQWLIASIEQRQNTLARVAQAIVDHQNEFLNKGPDAIEPLKMQQIADKVEVHVTTVSRAVDDKWIQTPRGIFPLKRFFCGGTVSADGEEVAWDAVRLKLKEIVDNEDKQHPLSDESLMNELAKHGLTVARRTVTKYRKAMNIPSSRKRMQWGASGKS